MNEKQRVAIKQFIVAVRGLKDASVIRSHRYLGDLAEFLCADRLKVNLSTNLREVGHDGVRETLRAQIKYGGGKKTNMDLGDPSKYEEIYVVLGKESVIRKQLCDADFQIYKFTSAQVFAMGKNGKGGYSCGPKHFRRPPDERIFINDAL
ncbi:hypothetical protein [Achromobacter marplatensis]|uniref:hypothetical protein n=1 Tax=Achromobacter marplatensis TaxID=470868 RepID=UPI0028EEFB0D|nr:hypothetical protein [Achromobacter marplatensis]